MFVILETILQYHEGKLIVEQMIKVAEAMYSDNPDRLQQELPVIEKCSNISTEIQCICHSLSLFFNNRGHGRVRYGCVDFRMRKEKRSRFNGQCYFNY
jgi:hypothetical protein